MAAKVDGKGNPLSPREMRELIRKGEWGGPTRGLCPGYACATLIVLPQYDAYDFLLFCQRNPRPCPVMEVTDVGSPYIATSAPGADLRTDVPKYRVFKRGHLEAEVADITTYWRNDSVAFLLGCGLTIEPILLEAGIPSRALEEQKLGAIYVTNIQCQPAGKFRGPLLVNMIPLPWEKAIKTIQITSKFPANHGAPIHIGDPMAIGIKDLSEPIFGEPLTMHQWEVPVFWACGATVQYIAFKEKLDLIITNAVAHMFITDMRADDFAVI